MSAETLKLGIQKSGRLQEDSLKLLKECGISIIRPNGKLKTQATNFPLEIYFLRNGDLLDYLRSGILDAAILGENTLIEAEAQELSKAKLGFARCRLSLAIPKEAEYTGPEWLEGKRIATSYPTSTRSFLGEAGISAQLHGISGSVELAPGMGLADAVCDLVSTGSTLFANGLKEVEVILRSEACLCFGEANEAKQETFDRLQFRIESVLRSRSNKYVLLNAPNSSLEKIIALLPGMKSPTVMPLAEEGWSSVHSVINENQFWEIIDQLRVLGAEGILIVPIEKMIA